MRISLTLADFAQADAAGKVNAIGLGWTTIPTPLGPFALVIFLDVEWSESNRTHKVKCELLTADDGQQVLAPGPEGPQPVVFEAVADTARPPGAIYGIAARYPLTVNFYTPLPLNPGRYTWRATVEGFDASAVETFLVQSPRPPGP